MVIVPLINSKNSRFDLFVEYDDVNNNQERNPKLNLDWRFLFLGRERERENERERERQKKKKRKRER